MSAVVACQDHNRRTCIQVFRDTKVVKYIPLNVADGLVVHSKPARDFDDTYKAIEGYPAAKAAKLYVGYSQNIGATPEALDFLGKVVNISQKEYQMATGKKAAAEASAEETKLAKKAAKKPEPKEPEGDPIPVPKGRKTVVKAADTKPQAPVDKTKPATKVPPVDSSDLKEHPKGDYGSASHMFKCLIMCGKYSDDEVFKKVQEKFGLPDKKRSYVHWYRNDLAKKGLNPPPAGGKKN